MPGRARRGRGRPEEGAGAVVRPPGRPGGELQQRPADEQGTVEFLFVEGFAQKTRENEHKFTQRCFRRCFNPLNATIGVVLFYFCH